MFRLFQVQLPWQIPQLETDCSRRKACSWLNSMHKIGVGFREVEEAVAWTHGLKFGSCNNNILGGGRYAPGRRRVQANIPEMKKQSKLPWRRWNSDFSSRKLKEWGQNIFDFWYILGHPRGYPHLAVGVTISSVERALLELPPNMCTNWSIYRGVYG